MNEDSAAIKHFNVTVRGRVQGVGFRYSAANQANALGIRGLVKNLPNRDVYLEIEGSDLATKLMLDWCHRGPGTSRVDQVFINEDTVKQYNTFRIAY